METLKMGSRGPLVELLQTVLNRSGYSAGTVDGIFGSRTERAVRAFQSANRLGVDGIVGPRTWAALMPYISRQTTYVVRSGDTLYRIAQRYGTTVAAIVAANPGITPDMIYPGQVLVVPLPGQITFTTIRYSSSVLELNLAALKERYPFLEIGTIGRSVLGTNIPYVKFGTGSVEVFYNGSHHANEWITTPLIVKFIERISDAYVRGVDLLGLSPTAVFNTKAVYFVPMVNPDGVDLVTGEIRPGTNAYNRAYAIRKNIPFPSGWKANIRGTDLNLNYPAAWEQARGIKFAQGFTTPGPRDYVGPAPLSEPETQSVAAFTQAHDFKLTISYHTQGGEIYWRFLNQAPPDSLRIGQLFAGASGYVLTDPPPGSAYAGYKDWFIQQYNKPGYTIEAGYGTSPLPISYFDTLYAENEGIMMLGAVEGK